jgi:hypothetical protein
MKKKDKEARTEKEIIYCVTNNILHTLIEISMPNELQEILDSDYENFGFKSQNALLLLILNRHF